MPTPQLPDIPVDEFARDRSPSRDDDPRIVYVEGDADGPNVWAVAILLAATMLLGSGLALLAAWLLW